MLAAVSETDESKTTKVDDVADDLISQLHDLNLDRHCIVDATSPRYSRDFGGMCLSHPAVVVRPTSSVEVSKVIQLCGSSSYLTVSPRGNGHSVSGQAMPVDSTSGIVLDMSGLASIEIDLGNENLFGPSAWVGGGALWEDVLMRGIENCMMAPRSWVDYLRLTVGGTLSNGGVSGQAFKFGPQTANVKELEVVTGKGDIISCSDKKDVDLFYGVLGGLGQFGVITRARISLYPAPEMVRWVRLVYTEFQVYAADAELLVSLDDSFDYVEGFVFVNSDDPINGWDSVPFSRGENSFDHGKIPPGAGPVLYCLELTVHYSCSQNAAEKRWVDKRVAKMVRGLRFVPGLEFTTDVGYVDFLTRVNQAEQVWRANGSWDAPHPWLNLFVSSADIADFDRSVFREILRDGNGGVMLVYPLLKSRWDPRASMALPESEVFYLVALLGMRSPFPDGVPMEQLMTQNEEIINHCVSSKYDFKLYLPHYADEEHWQTHFGNDWSRFVEMKSLYDPITVLTPGQRIFERKK